MQWLHADRAITGDGKTVLTPGWVCIEGDKILEVTDKTPENATPDNTVELKGATLTPGLINIHDHICRKEFRVDDPTKNFAEQAAKLMSSPKDVIILHSVANMFKYLTVEGITCTRDYGLSEYTPIHLRDAIKEGVLPGPEIIACGNHISITGGHCYRNDAEQVNGPWEVMKAVRKQIMMGAQFIKFMGSGGLERFPEEDPTMPQFTVEELKAGNEAAHDLGIDTAIHAYSTEGIRRAVEVGIDNIEHGSMMTEELVIKMAEKGINYNPTGSGTRDAVKRGSQFKYWDLLQERVYSKQENGIRWAKKYGVKVGAGTDSPGWMHEEIQWMADILGESPVEALKHGFLTNAEICKRNDIGLLEAGRKADIVAWNGDLTKSLEPLNGGVIMTWARGKAYKGSAFTPDHVAELVATVK